jgi:hypothetical protein
MTSSTRCSTRRPKWRCGSSNGRAHAQAAAGRRRGRRRRRGLRRVAEAAGRPARLGGGEGAVRALPRRPPLRRVRARHASEERARGDRAPPPRARRRSERLPARPRGRARPARARTAGRYFGVPGEFALTDSTTMGLGLVYGTLRAAARPSPPSTTSTPPTRRCGCASAACARSASTTIRRPRRPRASSRRSRPASTATRASRHRVVRRAGRGLPQVARRAARHGHRLEHQGVGADAAGDSERRRSVVPRLAAGPAARAGRLHQRRAHARWLPHLRAPLGAGGGVRLPGPARAGEGGGADPHARHAPQGGARRSAEGAARHADVACALGRDRLLRRRRDGRRRRGRAAAERAPHRRVGHAVRDRANRRRFSRSASLQIA